MLSTGLPLRLGVDIGGTKTEIAALDSCGTIQFRRRLNTPQGDYYALIQKIQTLVSEADEECGLFDRVGVCHPGSVSPTSGLIRNANSTAMNGKALQSDLETILKRPVRLANDANCFALSEAMDGAAEGSGIVFGVIIGTGVGGGIVIDRQILTGASGIGGEWGHNPLRKELADPEPRRCWCGRADCLETYLAGPAVSREHAAATGRILTVQEIVTAAEAGDAASGRTVALYIERLAAALAGIVNVIDPETMVLGGGLSNIGRLYAEVPNLWAPYVFSDRCTARLLPPKHGDSSGVRGAAWLWPES